MIRWLGIAADSASVALIELRRVAVFIIAHSTIQTTVYPWPPIDGRLTIALTGPMGLGFALGLLAFVVPFLTANCRRQASEYVWHIGVFEGQRRRSEKRT